MYYRERTKEEIESSSDKEILEMASARAENHRLWHENFSGEYDDCPFQYLLSSWLTKGEEKALEELGRAGLLHQLRAGRHEWLW